MDPALPFEPPRRFGRFRVLELLGEGGMGSVYLAEATDAPGTRFAIKVVKPGLDTKEGLARFDAEWHALGRMRHSGIAKAFEAGANEQGQPWFAMEYVPGVPIDRYCDDRLLGVRERLELFIRVCEAVQHAHQKGVIHRDLKPGNILVTTEGDHPVPKVIDFGLARAVDHRLTDKTLHTELGRVLGTGAYMSPEQTGLPPFDIDTRTDVYSLGVVLYELLVGRLPFTMEELHQAGALEAQRRIREEEPSRPSMCVAEGSDEVARRRRETARSLQRRISGELDWITMKALRKERERRYASALALGEDVQRYLDGEAVLAGPPSASYRVRRWLSRNRGRVSVATVLLLGLGSAGAAWAIEVIRRGVTEHQLRLATDRLSLEDLLQREQEDPELARPGAIPAKAAWLARVRELVDRAPDHRADVAELAARLASLRRDADHHTTDDVRSLELELEQRRRHLDALERIVGRHGAVTQVERRIAHSRELDRPMSRESARDWDAVRERTANNALYSGIEPIPPQTGIVPLGPDPRSHLEEFAVLGTGEVPLRDAEGRLVRDGRTALVLVLLPGGQAWIGSSRTENTPNFDLMSVHHPSEQPVQRVRLDPFFVAKFELTNAQYRAATSFEPAADGHDAESDHPVVDSRIVLQHVLWQLGLELPTEAQWEYAARAGSSEPWPGEGDVTRLGRIANLADRTATGAGAIWEGIDDRIEDGHVLTAPVGSLEPNAFGLYDTCGNVWEWCRSPHTDDHSAGFVDGAGEPRHAGGSRAVYRGGCYRSPTRVARVAYRQSSDPRADFGVIGARAVRAVLR